jgi:hypothetical protein
MKKAPGDEKSPGFFWGCGDIILKSLVTQVARTGAKIGCLGGFRCGVGTGDAGLPRETR